MKNNEHASRATKNHTTNYRMDKHEFFCRRCYNHNNGICPVTNRKVKSASCNI